MRYTGNEIAFHLTFPILVNKASRCVVLIKWPLLLLISVSTLGTCHYYELYLLSTSSPKNYLNIE